MTIDEALRAHLTSAASAAAVTALIGTRMYPDQVPQKPTLPCIGYAVLEGEQDTTHDGLSGYMETTFELVCMAKDRLAAKDLAQKVKLALDAFPAVMGGAGGVEVDGVFVTGERNDFDDELRVYWTILDVLIEHEAPTA